MYMNNKSGSEFVSDNTVYFAKMYLQGSSVPLYPYAQTVRLMDQTNYFPVTWSIIYKADIERWYTCMNCKETSNAHVLALQFSMCVAC